MDIRYRAYIACWAAAKGRLLPGDFVECGVNLGGLSRTAMEYTDFNATTKQFWLLDTYCGIPEEQLATRQRTTMSSVARKPVRQSGRDVPRIPAGEDRSRIGASDAPAGHRGQSLLPVDRHELCRAGNRRCGVFLGQVVPRCGHGVRRLRVQRVYAKQRHAFDEFCRHRSVQVLCLPTGQGLIFKPS